MKTTQRLAIIAVVIAMLMLPAVTRADGPIAVTASTATSEFPQALVFKLNVTDSAADIKTVELHFKLRGDASTEVAKPEFTPGRRIEATYRWRTASQTTPPGAPVEFYWTITDAAGNTLTTDSQTAIYDDLRFRWKQLKNDDIAFFWYEGSQDFGQTVFDEATRSLARISADVGAKVKYPIRIYAYANQDDFRSAFPALGNTQAWIGGMAFSEQAITVQILPDQGERTTWIRTVIPHEVCHLIFYQATHHSPADPPTWLNEGLAQYYEEGDHADQVALVEETAREGKLFPLRALSGGFFNDPEKTYLAYAESYSAVDYIFTAYGRDGMARLIRAFGAGKAREAAWQEAFGISLDQFDRNWQEGLGVTLPTVTPVPTPSPTEDRPWMNPTLPPWASKGTPSGASVTVTPGAATSTPPPRTPTVPPATPAPESPGTVWPATLSGDSLWLTVAGGAFCCVSVILVVVFFVGLVWLTRRS